MKQTDDPKQAPRYSVGQAFRPYRLFRNFATIPTVVLGSTELTFGEKLCWQALAMRQGSTGPAFPSYETIAKDLGLKDRSQAIRLVSSLEKKGFLRVVAQYRSRSQERTANEYEFLWHPSFKGAEVSLPPAAETNKTGGDISLPGGDISSENGPLGGREMSPIKELAKEEKLASYACFLSFVREDLEFDCDEAFPAQLVEACNKALGRGQPGITEAQLIDLAADDFNKCRKRQKGAGLFLSRLPDRIRRNDRRLPEVPRYVHPDPQPSTEHHASIFEVPRTQRTREQEIERLRELLAFKGIPPDTRARWQSQLALYSGPDAERKPPVHASAAAAQGTLSEVASK